MELALDRLYDVHDREPPVTLARLIRHAMTIVRTPYWALPAKAPMIQMHATRLIDLLDDDLSRIEAQAEAFAAQVRLASREVRPGADKHTNGKARDLVQAAREKRERDAAWAKLNATARQVGRPSMRGLWEVRA